MKAQLLTIDPTSEEARCLMTALLEEHYVHRKWLLNCQQIASGGGSKAKSHQLLVECYAAHNAAEERLSTMVTDLLPEGRPACNTPN